jgi:hypothetical protein
MKPQCIERGLAQTRTFISGIPPGGGGALALSLPPPSLPFRRREAEPEPEPACVDSRFKCHPFYSLVSAIFLLLSCQQHQIAAKAKPGVKLQLNQEALCQRRPTDKKQGWTRRSLALSEAALDPDPLRRRRPEPRPLFFRFFSSFSPSRKSALSLSFSAFRSSCAYSCKSA